jgi:hypothetical protein
MLFICVAIFLRFATPQPRPVAEDLVKEHQLLMCNAIKDGNIERAKKLLAAPYIDINDEDPCGCGPSLSYLGWLV